MTNQLVAILTTQAAPTLIAAAGDRARICFLEFFTAN
jgi:hypothetical protein